MYHFVLTFVERISSLQFERFKNLLRERTLTLFSETKFVVDQNYEDGCICNLEMSQLRQNERNYIAI